MKPKDMGLQERVRHYADVGTAPDIPIDSLKELLGGAVNNVLIYQGDFSYSPDIKNSRVPGGTVTLGETEMFGGRISFG